MLTKCLSGFVAPQDPGEALKPGFSFTDASGVWGLESENDHFALELFCTKHWPGAKTYTVIKKNVLRLVFHKSLHTHEANLFRTRL